MELKLHRKEQEPGGIIADGKVMMTPPIGVDYWRYCVPLTEGQAVLGFPKFSVIGIGFAAEEDWNTNLPSSCGTEEIFQHIKHNKGDESISDDDVRKAIAMIQAAVIEDKVLT